MSLAARASQGLRLPLKRCAATQSPLEPARAPPARLGFGAAAASGGGSLTAAVEQVAAATAAAAEPAVVTPAQSQLPQPLQQQQQEPTKGPSVRWLAILHVMTQLDKAVPHSGEVARGESSAGTAPVAPFVELPSKTAQGIKHRGQRAPCLELGRGEPVILTVSRKSEAYKQSIMPHRVRRVVAQTATAAADSGAESGTGGSVYVELDPTSWVWINVPWTQLQRDMGLQKSAGSAYRRAWTPAVQYYAAAAERLLTAAERSAIARRSSDSAAGGPQQAPQLAQLPPYRRLQPVHGPPPNPAASDAAAGAAGPTGEGADGWPQRRHHRPSGLGADEAAGAGADSLPAAEKIGAAAAEALTTAGTAAMDDTQAAKACSDEAAAQVAAAGPSATSDSPSPGVGGAGAAAAAAAAEEQSKAPAHASITVRTPSTERALDGVDCSSGDEVGSRRGSSGRLEAAASGWVARSDQANAARMETAAAAPATDLRGAPRAQPAERLHADAKAVADQVVEAAGGSTRPVPQACDQQAAAAEPTTAAPAPGAGAAAAVAVDGGDAAAAAAAGADPDEVAVLCARRTHPHPQCIQLPGVAALDGAVAGPVRLTPWAAAELDAGVDAGVELEGRGTASGSRAPPLTPLPATPALSGNQSLTVLHVTSHLGMALPPPTARPAAAGAGGAAAARASSCSLAGVTAPAVAISSTVQRTGLSRLSAGDAAILTVNTKSADYVSEILPHRPAGGHLTCPGGYCAFAAARVRRVLLLQPPPQPPPDMAATSANSTTWVELDPISWVWMDVPWEIMQLGLGLPGVPASLRKLAETRADSHFMGTVEKLRSTADATAAAATAATGGTGAANNSTIQQQRRHAEQRQQQQRQAAGAQLEQAYQGGAAGGIGTAPGDPSALDAAAHVDIMATSGTSGAAHAESLPCGSGSSGGSGKAQGRKRSLEAAASLKPAASGPLCGMGPPTAAAAAVPSATAAGAGGGGGGPSADVVGDDRLCSSATAAAVCAAQPAAQPAAANVAAGQRAAPGIEPGAAAAARQQSAHGRLGGLGMGPYGGRDSAADAGGLGLGPGQSCGGGPAQMAASQPVASHSEAAVSPITPAPMPRQQQQPQQQQQSHAPLQPQSPPSVEDLIRDVEMRVSCAAVTNQTLAQAKAEAERRVGEVEAEAQRQVAAARAECEGQLQALREQMADEAAAERRQREAEVAARTEAERQLAQAKQQLNIHAAERLAAEQQRDTEAAGRVEALRQRDAALAAADGLRQQLTQVSGQRDAAVELSDRLRAVLANVQRALPPPAPV
ncbi:hypothetical protein HXX76_012757 [Chlamydomonas incerta]|uniref:Uncharacterized protein n=1 Tax=Chlamydomonas incerta TaxID=51695 RepID=A0A835VRW6_CHLIN|nr:hypothetical protein HXX76_012757 [Chlamydomonas incerta]|eukprot:KAG2426972.1 hypothetical protein HXX76_012757 [Chlamydomonas incerta]